MKLAKGTYVISVAIVIAALCIPTFSQELQKPWAGTLGNGTKINEKELQKIIVDHEEWLKNKKTGKKADLSKGNLKDVVLSRDLVVDILSAYFQGPVELWRVDRTGVNLQKANLLGTNLQEAKLSGVNLQEANLMKANLQGAKLLGVNLQQANLMDANLQSVDLSTANLKGANLFSANLKKANLSGCNLQGAKLFSANLEGVVFEIKPNNLPDIPFIAEAVNLYLLEYKKSPHALVELREAFKKFGLRRQEREVTYAIKHSGYVNGMARGDLPTRIQVILGRLFFELTCQWGMSPLQPLLIMIGFIGLFSPLYIYSLKKQNKKDGIWKFWINERARKDLGADEPELLTCHWKGAVGNGLYFSVLSAFHVGWRDINVGSWIARMQPREYRLQASGWVRFVSGLQSLLSVYLLALSVLAYFGRPFESY